MADKGRRKRAVEYGDNPCTLEKSDARVSVPSCISSCTSTYGGNGKSHRGNNFARCSRSDVRDYDINISHVVNCVREAPRHI